MKSTFQLGLRVMPHLLALTVLANAAPAETIVPLPDTISPQARTVIEQLSANGLKQLKAPAPEDIASWKALHAKVEAAMKAPNQAVLQETGAIVTQDMINGVPVLDVRPKGWKENGRAILYVHGGAFTLFSAESMAGLAALMAEATGLRVISVDYTPAPEAQWEKMQAQVDAVYRGLLANGVTMDHLAAFGDSAGGNLILRAVLDLRDSGQGVPAALVLFSPWVDLANAGDTAITLKDADPTLSYDGLLGNSARAYAGGLNLSDPRVSPLYADFGNRFPPTLIQEGTRTILLSGSVRLYRALRAAEADVAIDMYEGMWHVFQGAPTPEAKTALTGAAAFIRSKLK